MSDHDFAGPSLLLAQHDKAHREHSKQYQHQHHRLHRREETVTEVVTEVVATVSVVQKIDVDSNGNTFTVQSTLSDSTGSTSPGVLTDEISSATSDIASPPITYSGSQASSTVADSSSLLSGLNVPPVSTSFLSIPTSFASLIVSSNSTALVSSSSSSSHTHSNTSISSTRSSLSYLRSARSSLLTESSTEPTSTLYSLSSSDLATATDVGGILGAGTGTGGPEATSATDSAGGSDSSTGTTPTPVVIGGVVGSIAGAAVIIIALLFIFRWKKRGQMLSLGSGGADAIGEAPTTQPSSDMTERRSLAFAVPAALASLTGYKNKRYSEKTERTISSTAGSERGFYRVSGRKLPSVLQTGGDGYGGGIPDQNTLSGSSFYRDSQGFYGGSGAPVSPPLGISMQRDSGIPIMRPSPARTPVTEHGPFSGSLPDINSPPQRPDVLGRSHPSQDGSHTSKFTEEV